jgi:hypothetical protein
MARANKIDVVFIEQPYKFGEEAFALQFQRANNPLTSKKGTAARRKLAVEPSSRDVAT